MPISERFTGRAHCGGNETGLGERAEMLKLSLVVLFVVSLATLSFASSLMPVPAAVDEVQALASLN